jgi:hypothetical protein
LEKGTLDKKRGRTSVRPKSREETPEKGMQQTGKLVAMHNVIGNRVQRKRKVRINRRTYDISDLGHFLTI